MFGNKKETGHNPKAVQNPSSFQLSSTNLPPAYGNIVEQTREGLTDTNVPSGLFTIPSTTQSFAGLFSTENSTASADVSTKPTTSTLFKSPLGSFSSSSHSTSPQNPSAGSSVISNPQARNSTVQYSNFPVSQTFSSFSGDANPVVFPSQFATSSFSSNTRPPPSFPETFNDDPRLSNRKRTSEDGLPGYSGLDKFKKKTSDVILITEQAKEAKKRFLVRSLAGNIRKPPTFQTPKEKLDRKRSSHDEGSGFIRRPRIPSSSISPQEDTPSIQCTKVPKEHNNPKDLRKHFERFGKVIRARPNIVKHSATIQFSKSSEAAFAKEKGKTFYGCPIHIYFYKSRTQSTDKSPNHQTIKQNTTVVPKSRSGHTGKQSVQSRSLLAKNDVDKLAILDKIDKLLRSRTIKQSDLSKAKVSKGTCPDMCPEKERYLRSQRNLLSPYEMDSMRRIDHRMAVKEYSRSSADQEEPLPHELRPPPVLRVTMDYLVTYVMREIDYDKTAEWYDFIWNRTRAIRKEISIQQASDPYAIEVTEECARFHICCAHELCEADLNNFDPKINNENLEKTMKTVLDMYQDVYLRNPEYEPPNEAEFRAYFILLNINRSSDVLSAVKLMRPEIRYSEPVRLAVAAFSAIHSNNYSRFFIVLHQATYLQAALLHRYFTQVRLQAIRIMTKAYTPSSSSTILADGVIRRLCFNDMNELILFCECCEIQLINGQVKLIKGIDYSSEGLSPICSHAVSGKMGGLGLGEIITHGRKPSSEIHPPSSSFDDNGYYIGPHAGLLTHSTIVSKSELPESSTQVSSSTRDREQTNAYAILEQKGITNAFVKSITRNLFLEIISETVDDVAMKAYIEAQRDLQCEHVTQEIVNEVVVKIMRGFASNAILDEKMDIENKQRDAEEAERQIREAERKRQEEDLRRREEERKRKENERRKKEKAEAIKRISEQLSIKIENETLEELVTETTRSVWRDARLDHYSSITCKDLMNSFATSFLRDIARDARKVERKNKHSLLQQQFELITTKIRLKKWRSNLEKIRLYRRSCELFPCTSLSRDIHQQISELLYISRDNAGGQKKPRLSIEPLPKLVSDHDRLLETVDQKSSEINDLHYKPISFTQIVHDNFPIDGCCGISVTYSSTHWKLVLASPTMQDTGIWQTWIQRKFGLRKTHSPPCLNEILTSKLFFNAENPPCTRKISVCCKMIKNEEQNIDDLFGASAIAIIITENMMVKLNDIKSFMKNLLSSFRPLPLLPLLLLLCQPVDDENELLQDLEIFSHPAVSSVRIMTLYEDDFARNGISLIEGITYLASSSDPPPDLEVSQLRMFVEEQLLSHYINPLYEHMKCLEDQGMGSLDPYSIHDLYNQVLTHICSCLTDQSLLNISWPAKEFRTSHDDIEDTLFPCQGWNSEANFKELETIFDQLKLPELPKISSCEFVEEIEELFAKYCNKVCPTKRHLTVSIMKSIESFAVDNKIEDVSTFIYCFPWQRLIDAIASSMFESVLYNKQGSLLVAYFESSLEQIELPDWFLSQSQNLKFYSLNEKPRTSIQTTDLTDNSMNFGSYANLSKIMKAAESNNKLNTSSDWIAEDDETQLTANQTMELRADIANDIAASKRFEENLKRIIEDGNN